ncbi:NAD(P)-binding protein [Ramicandelaber brevisporus]|nr:NAD(P)-binding protein [Ramicandelaber brevisporus]
MSSFIIPAVHKVVPFIKTGPASVLKAVEQAAPQPESLAKGGIIVRNHVSGINFGDVLRRIGQFPYPTESGTVMGIEAAGVVVASRNPSFIPGERVVYNSYPQGTYGEYLRIDNTFNVAKLPDDISFETAGSSLVIGLTAISLFKAHEVKPGQTIVVWAAGGGIGQALVQLAKNVHGARVIGVTSSDAKAKVVKEAGADEVVVVPHGAFNGKPEDHPLVKRVNEITGGRGVDAIYDGVGATAFEASLAALGLNGTLVQYGITSGPNPPLDTMRLSAKNNRVQFYVLAHDLMRPGGFDSLSTELITILQKGQLKVPIFRQYKLEEIAQAHSDLESGISHGKCVITFDN